ncbi:MAG: DUF4827 family protein [Muribaculaceae bacterium]|nr:DUF4827 family protein [Muribaculaceae bacterium]
MKNIKSLLYALCMILFATSFVGCNESKSYAELLNDERHATNSFLANYRIVNEIPADSVFETGENAPFYRIDPDGQVYMQVVSMKRHRDDPAKYNDPIYFRYMRYDLLSWYTSGIWEGEGNATEMSLASTYFMFSNFSSAASAQYGYGIQLPLTLIGVDSEVNIIVKSQYGKSDEISYVRPFLYRIRYFRSKI